MPMAAQALTLYRLLVAQGKGELDGAAAVPSTRRPIPRSEGDAGMGRRAIPAKV